MSVQDIIKNQLDYTNVSEWREKCIAGKGIKVWNGEALGGHGTDTRTVLEQVATEAEILSYNIGFWNINRVWNVAGKAITEEDYFEITGFTYPNKA